MLSIGIIGFGNMGEAIAAGLRRSADDVDLFVMEPAEERFRVARDSYGANAVASSEELLKTTEICVLAVKPQIIDSVTGDLGASAEGRRFVSVAAGVSVSYLRERLRTTEIVRFMPNLAATVGRALVGICYSDPIEATTTDLAFRIADSIGDKLIVPERLMSAVTGVSGSGIAYVFALTHAMALGGTQSGLPYRDALSAAISAIEGAATLLKESKLHPIELLTRVTSPAGTTIEGVAELEERGFTSAVMQAVVAAARRADELEK